MKREYQRGEKLFDKPNSPFTIGIESFASNVVNTQSIGRGLALVDGKEKYILHDITDVFSQKYAEMLYCLLIVLFDR